MVLYVDTHETRKVINQLASVPIDCRYQIICKSADIKQYTCFKLIAVALVIIYSYLSHIDEKF